MKGGTATKLLLEIVLTLAIQAVEGAGVSDPVALERQARCMLEEYSAATVRVYRSATDIAAAVDLAGAALRRGGRIVYLASEALGRLAVIGASWCALPSDCSRQLMRRAMGVPYCVADASECPPTYGADFSDVRAFVRGGWPSLLRVASAAGEEGSERAGGSGAGQELPGVSWREFEEHWLPTLKEGDLVVGLTMCSTRVSGCLPRCLLPPRPLTGHPRCAGGARAGAPPHSLRRQQSGRGARAHRGRRRRAGGWHAVAGRRHFGGATAAAGLVGRGAGGAALWRAGGQAGAQRHLHRRARAARHRVPEPHDQPHGHQREAVPPRHWTRHCTGRLRRGPRCAACNHLRLCRRVALVAAH